MQGFLRIDDIIEFLMRKRTFFITVALTVLVLYWALLIYSLFTGHNLIEWAINSTERTVFVESANLEDLRGIKVLDANNPFFQILRMEPNRVDVVWKEANRIDLQESICRVQKLNSQLAHVMAEINNKQYPVAIDSGFSEHLMVNDVVIIENQFEIFPFEHKTTDSAGFCHLEKVQIGDMTITNPPCLYTLGHYEKRLLGRTKWKQSQIIFGLALMRHFRYVLVDNISSIVEFGMGKSFAPDPNESWLKYPMALETDEKNMRRIMVEIPIAGRVRQVAFDTGASNNLLVSQSIWKKFSEVLEVVGTSENRIRMIYGWEEVSINTVGELGIGERVVSNATVAVLSNGSKKGPDFFLLGMGYFKDTAIVLDFENNLLWIRRADNLPTNSKVQS